jgi:imidazolonepropionase-like amidohydrolase
MDFLPTSIKHGSVLPSIRDYSRRQYRAKLPLSLLFAITIILAFQFFILPRYIYQNSPSVVKLSQFHLDHLDAGLRKCEEYNTPPVHYPVPAASRSNPRWNSKTGQNETIILRNVTLFDGKTILGGSYDVEFEEGIIKSVSAAGTFPTNSGVKTWELAGKFVTPGLVDIHSHHLAIAWPMLSATDDSNEVSDDFGPLTPFVRSIDSMKAYDEATTIIASGGVTSSLILPGSANIMGGEAYLVKNLLRSGPEGEEVVEEILLEHGIAKEERRRYMKMACGENPSRVYSHNRMGNSWIFREHMERAKVLREKQDAWCLSAAVARESRDVAAIAELMESTTKNEETATLELDSTMAMLRGKIGVNVHCYETEDFEDMISHSKEFGFRIQAFHHALSAWQVPEMIKDSGENITIATFSEFGFYKKEGYESNLWAGKILAEHGVPVAYKSDHVREETNAKYLLFQAATAHAFHLPADLALQSVTSIPARSLEIDHRVGFVRTGYDADIVVWDSHPLAVGATPLQVYIDGRATLNPKKVTDSQPRSMMEKNALPVVPKQRKVLSSDAKEGLCGRRGGMFGRIIIRGIKESFLEIAPEIESGLNPENLTMVVQDGIIVCFSNVCPSATSEDTVIELEDGYVLPGLTAVSVSLGLLEIPSEEVTSDGQVSTQSSGSIAEDIIYAKYAVHFDGKNFNRARIGGVTRTISAPRARGFAGGVSVGIKTKEQKTLSLDDGIFQDEVGLHFRVGQASKST